MKNFPRELPHGSGVTLILDATRLLIDFREPTESNAVERSITSHDLMLEPSASYDYPGERPRAEIVNHTETRFWVRTRSGRLIDDEMYEGVRDSLSNRIGWIGPVYDTPSTPGRGGRVCPLPNVLVLRAMTGGDPLVAVAQSLGLREDTNRSRYLIGFHVFMIANPEARNAYQLRDLILQRSHRPGLDVKFETMPMVRDLTFNPNDTFYPQQWNMTQIDAGGAGTTGWDISLGSAAVSVAVMDYGFDLAHPDLTYVAGINLSTMAPLTAATSGTDPHGTACSGIVAAAINNAAGVAGMAGACPIMPVRRVSGSDVETATGITWAVTNGAQVLSMSFGRYAPGDGIGPTGWDFTLIDPSIASAVNVSGAVLCSGSGNEDLGTVNRYPGRHALVLCCGASDQADNRKSPASPDGEPWGSNYGSNVHLGVTTGVSVVAPGVLIPTTDHQGTEGYNAAAGAAGDYFMMFNGVSAATPHVAGLAALLRSQYPALTNIEVRTIIERTVEKVGALAYAETVAFLTGTRNAQMGYGRINVHRALDYADMMIRDYPLDTGAEPSTPPGGDFWDFSDIVVRGTDDNVFNPSDPSQSSQVEKGQTNYIYVRVTNNGPRDASNVVVNARITPWVGIEFAYPTDWTLVDANHVSPTPITASFGMLLAGASATAKFSISSAQVDTLWGWISGSSWHPCLLASVNADNDYGFATAAFATSPPTLRRNNLAQRNLTVVDDVTGGDMTFPFLAGHRLNRERMLELVVDRRLFAGAAMYLLLDDDRRSFPASVYEEIASGQQESKEGIEFLERTRIHTRVGCCEAILVLEKGSRLICEHSQRPGEVDVKGGQVILKGGKRLVQLTELISYIRIEKEPGAVFPLALLASITPNIAGDTPLTVRVSQRNERGDTVGGATATYILRQAK